MHARANRRLSACDRIFDISGKQGLNRPRTAGQEDNIGVDADAWRKCQLLWRSTE